MAVSYEQVAQSADKMVAQGDDPVIRKIREMLGEGSLGTIQKHLSTWRKEKRHAAASSPTGLSEEATRILLSEIRKEVASATRSLSEELERLKGENADLARECEIREQEGANLQQRLQKTQEEVQRSLGENRRLLAESERERSDAEEARKEQVKAELRLEALPSLQEEIATLRQALEEERERRVAAEKEWAVTQALLEQTRPKGKERSSPVKDLK